MIIEVIDALIKSFYTSSFLKLFNERCFDKQV